MNKIYVMVFYVSVLLFINVELNFSQSQFNLPDKVDFSESQRRFYVHYDYFGNPPENLGTDRLKGLIKSGDEISVRFYPNILFKLDADKMIDNNMKMKKNSQGAFILFPFSQPDTFSVQKCYGAVYFITKLLGGKYQLRIATDSSKMKIGDKTDVNTLQDLSFDIPRDLDSFSIALHENDFAPEWKVKVFENILFKKGKYFIEIYYTGKYSAILEDRIVINVTDVYKSPSLQFNRDLSKLESVPMKNDINQSYYEALLNSFQNSAGVLNINIIYSYSEDSWYYKVANTASSNRKLKFNDDIIVIEKEKQLPSNIRARAGFGAFNQSREARLISNFVLVLFPEDYFTNSTPFEKRFNPTLGIQIGGTGTQDIIFLMGVSFKIINEGDIICGFRFKTDLDNAWKPENNFYFGISLDPGLFNQLNEKQ
jgi:hypothetical protein